ncbi:MAG: hypothetical protein KUG77_19780 [Nannocystaceae bacterium]|nr:hypothetical protein [Nannocystaceae bacterium]
MKTSTLLLSATLSLLASGCIDTKDVGVESDASSGAASTDGSGASMGGSASSGVAESGSTSGTSSSMGTATVASTATTGAGSDSDETGGVATTFVESSGSSSGGDTVDFAESIQCESSGGIWDLESCGHYTCGFGPDCKAVVPGCDCGVGSTFVEGVGGGCEPSDECEAVEFACGPKLTCSAPTEFCDVLVPGVQGAETSYTCLDTPDSCSEAYTCGCIDGAGDCETGPEGGLTVTVNAP